MFRLHQVNQVIVEKILADLKKPFVYWKGKKDFSLFGMAAPPEGPICMTSQIFRQAQTVLNQNHCSLRLPYPVTTSDPVVEGGDGHRGSSDILGKRAASSIPYDNQPPLEKRVAPVAQGYRPKKIPLLAAIQEDSSVEIVMSSSTLPHCI
jgi:hypothetical protein